MTRAIVLAVAMIACAPMRAAYPTAPCGCSPDDVCVVVNGGAHCASREAFR